MNARLENAAKTNHFFIYPRKMYLMIPSNTAIKPITKSLVLSLPVLVLLLPWGKVFGGMVRGAMFSPEELATAYVAKSEGLLSITLYYLRFGGYPSLRRSKQATARGLCKNLLQNCCNGNFGS